MSSGKLGIFAGKGELPRLITQACLDKGRPFCVVAFENNTPPEAVAGHEHLWTRFGAVGATMDELRAKGVSTLVMAGRLERPSLSSLKPDAKAGKLLKKLGAGLFSGDDRMLRIITEFLEEEGFTIIGADELLGEAVTPKGFIGRYKPNASERRDIEQGYRLAKIIGAEDVGQAVIVHEGSVLGLEAAEGTDALIERCAGLKDGKGGVLVKACKPQQERRADLPAIGPETVVRIKDGNFAGIALEAERSLIVQREKVVRLADEFGIFIYGIEPKS